MCYEVTSFACLCLCAATDKQAECVLSAVCLNDGDTVNCGNAAAAVSAKVGHEENRSTSAG